MIASDIKNLIAGRHTDDIFVPECKDGPTWGASHLRMDAWAMKRSWSNPLATAYEVKVSRSDFLNDDKWHLYRDMCHEIYFACPSKLIDPSELPDDVGLMWATEGAKRLYIKRKAKRRDVQVPAEVYMYILIARSKICDPHENTRSSQRDRIAHFLDSRNERREWGQIASKRIRQIVEEKVHTVETENYRLKKENESLSEVKKLLESLDVNPHQWDVTKMVKQKLSNTFNDFEMQAILDAADAINRVKELTCSKAGAS